MINELDIIIYNNIEYKYGLKYTKARQAVVKIVGEGDEIGKKASTKTLK